MLRAVYSMLFLVLSTASLFGVRLKADEPIEDSSSLQEESSVSFERRQFTVSRHKGKIHFDGAEAPRQILANKSNEVRLIETFDGLQFTSDKAFIQWAHKLKGPRTYTYDEVNYISKDGATAKLPLVFFDKESRIDLDPKWYAWLAMRQAEIEKANQIRLDKEQEAKRYQQLANFQELQAQVLIAQASAAERSADSLAVISGATSLWEVELVPTDNYGFCTSCTANFGGYYYGSQITGLAFFANGNNISSTFGSSFNYGNGFHSTYVRAYGRTSKIASDYALSSHPGYRVGGIRKLAGY